MTNDITKITNNTLPVGDASCMKTENPSFVLKCRGNYIDENNDKLSTKFKNSVQKGK